ncbi:MAG: nicotinate (nicotinamide) nucleotide adenylyltransferase [Candidatus Caenarcaniphilales bacterium]|nr:nicotinate (nicotinamide) nucleotide adenylyltransferase [Candidatus Caenarcaniphilales bacterium]
MKLALFGGSFDPIHNGHSAIAKQAKLALQLDEVHFILAKQSPFKIYDERGKAAPQKEQAEQRLNILKTALSEKEYRELNFKAIDIELKRPAPSYSYQTVEYYKEHYPDAQLFWIMGEDNYYSLDKWKNSDYLIENLEFIVFRRREAEHAIKDENPQNQQSPHRLKRTHFIQSPYYDVSSTQIREAITNSADLDFLAENLPNSIYGLVVQNYK